MQISFNGKRYEASVVDGPNGEFEIAFCGAWKEGPSYLYCDAQSTVFFQTDPWDAPTRVSITFFDDTGTDWRKNRETIEANIAFFFKAQTCVFS